MKRAIGVTAGLLMAAGQAHALNVGGIEFDTGSVFKQGLEIVVASGGGADGVGEITQITSNGVQTWASGDNGVDLFFDIHGYVETSSLADPGNAFDLEALGTGGSIDFYTLPAGTFEIGTSGGIAAARAAITGGTLWLETDARTMPAAVCGHGAAHAPVTTTICSNTNLATGVTLGFGPLDVVGGLAEENFDTNSRLGALGVDISWNFSHQGAGTGPFGGTDESGTGNFLTEAVDTPEPGTLALIGLGLVAMGGGAFRRKKKLA